MKTIAISRHYFAICQYVIFFVYSLLCLFSWPGLLKAETVYLAPVSGFSTFLAEDELRQHPDFAGAPSVQRVPVWSPLEVLERIPAEGLRSEFWLKVKTESGEVGWTLSDYVLPDQPDMGVIQILSDPSGHMVDLLPRSETPVSHMRGLVQEVPSGTEAYLVMTKPPYWSLVRTTEGQAGWVYDRQLMTLSEYQGALGQAADEEAERLPAREYPKLCV